jgi:general secretion pathway protein K
MLVVTIAAVLAVQLAWDTALDLRRTESLLGWEQARQFAYGAEDLAARGLREDAERSASEPADWFGEEWAQPRTFTLDLGTMSGQLSDMQGRFNLNNLVGLDGRRDDQAYEIFRRLLAILKLDAAIADAVVDWIDADTSAGFNGAEDDVYTGQQPPYRVANYWFTSVSELRAVRGVDAPGYVLLAANVTALPRRNAEPTRININTATPALLQALSDSLTAANVEQWITDRVQEPFEDLDVLTGFVEADVALKYCGIASDYFALQALVAIGSTRLGLYSLLERNGQSVLVRLRSVDAIDVTPEAGLQPDGGNEG